MRVHEGDVELTCTFSDVWEWVKNGRVIELCTAKGTPFSVLASVSRDGRRVLRFLQQEKEFARAYDCCWGHYYNCNRTRIGMYSRALDEAASIREPKAR